MKISNIGMIKEADIELNDLTIFCGKNNVGKTYLSYFMYSFIEYIKSDEFRVPFVDEETLSKLLAEFDVELKSEHILDCFYDTLKNDYIESKGSILSETYKFEDNFEEFQILFTKEELNNILRVNEMLEKTGEMIREYFYKGTRLEFYMKEDKLKIELLGDSEIKFDVPTSSILDTINEMIKGIFVNKIRIVYFPAERLGINVFKKELNEKRLNKYEEIMRSINREDASINGTKRSFYERTLQLHMSESRYAKPIRDYMSFINKTDKTIDENKSHYKNITDEIRIKILEGKFVIVEDDIYFREISGTKKFKTTRYPFHVLSSSLKSMYGFDYFVSKAKEEENKFLFIDEPEISLHPEKQLEMAIIIQQLIKNGFKVILSTHSEHFITKIYNLVIYNETKKQKGITSSNYNLYVLKKDRSIEKVDVIGTKGMVENFSNTNRILDEEYMEVMDQYYESLKPTKGECE